jgi:predicted esterase
MKRKMIAPMLVLALMLTMLAPSALALNYNPIQNAEATFETLEEARVSGPIEVADLETNASRTYASHPVLDGYPEGTTYVYRSAGMFGGRAAARLNTNLVVFANQAFADKDAALAYLKELGVIDIIDEAIGSVVLVTPANPETGFGAADQKNYYALQTAMLAQKASGMVDDVSISYSDAEYFGGYGYLYVIGADDGASTFLNNYVANTFDYVSRIAGMLLIGGGMDRVREVAEFVPVYLVNAPEAVQAKYKAINGVDALLVEGEKTTEYNQAFPLRKVVTVSAEAPDAKAIISDAYYNMFIKAMRLPILTQGLYTASTPYQSYNFDSAPYSLCERNALINGVTEDGIYITHYVDDEKFTDVKTENGEYLQTWFEYLPEEIVNGTAPDDTIPLILTMHGGGDDPRLFVDENGYLELAGKERIAMVAPEHQSITAILPDVLPSLVKYMLETYPALDESRVYVTGYSMGGWATYAALYGDASLFAAAVPMAIISLAITEEQEKQFETVDVPIMPTTSEYDYFVNPVDRSLPEMYLAQVNQFLGYNEMDPLPVQDFEKYPVSGFAGDSSRVITLNGEYVNRAWFFNNEDGIPMVGVAYTEGLVHGLYPPYAEVMWDFCKQYSRNPETLEISYNPYID